MLEDGQKAVIIQRDKQTYAIAPHVPCGVVSAEHLRKLADVSEKYGVAAMKITSAARIVLVGVKEEDVDAIWAEMGNKPGAAIGLCVRSVKACPGTTFCKRGIQDSLSMGMALDEIYHGMELPGKLKMGVSGCPNQCAETCIKDVGLVGKKPGWDLMVGGNGGARPRLSQKIADGLSDDEARALIAKVIEYYRANAKPRERLGKMLERIGIDELKAAVL